MNVVSLVIAAILLVVPIAVTVGLVRKRRATKVEWVISAVIAAAFVGYS